MMQRVAERRQGGDGSDVALASEGARLRMTNLGLGEIRTDSSTQLRVAMNQDTVKEYEEAYRAGEPVPPVEVFFDGESYWLADGWHRLAAYKMAHDVNMRNFSGQSQLIEVRMHMGTRRDAVLYAAQANARHGLRRTQADKRKAVEKLLLDEEWSQWSDREIARRCAVSDRLVNTIRAELEATAKIRSRTERKGADGRVINVTPIKSAARMRYVPADEFVPPADDLPVREVEPSVVPSSAASSRAYLPALGTCSICKRPLSDPEHAANGCGPVCAAKKAAQAAEDASEELSFTDEPPLSDSERLRVLVAAAREAMGAIDLDPCSLPQQQVVVNASYWCYPADGMQRQWGGSVFLHPPQGAFLPWLSKAVQEYDNRRIHQAVVILPADTGSGWFQSLLNGNMVTVCFLAGSPQIAVYLGSRIAEFDGEFHHLGVVMQQVDL